MKNNSAYRGSESRWNLRALLVLSIISGVGLFAPHRVVAHEGEDHGAPPATTIGLGPIKLSDAARQSLEIQIEELDVGTINGLLRCFGEIKPVPGKVFWSSTRVAGRVIRVVARPGVRVQKGDLLAEIEARQVARAPNVIHVRSGISGTVTEQNISVGQPIEPQTLLFLVADLSTVYLKCHVYESDVARVQVGQSVLIYPESMPGEMFEGKIEFVGGQLSEHGRTLPVWARLSNSAQLLKIGMRARVEIIYEESKDVVKVPVDAVLGELGNYFVFLESGDYFVGQPIGIGLRDSAYVEVSDGLFPGDRVVTRGAYQLQYAAASVADTGITDGDNDQKSASEQDDSEQSPLEVKSPVAPQATADPGIWLSDVARNNLRLASEEVDLQVVNRLIQSFGKVEALPTRLHIISTPISGRASEVFVSEGQRVKAGDLLATIESRQVADPPKLIEVRSTISGIIIVQHIFHGEAVEPDKSLFTIVDISTLLVRSHVYEKDVNKVSVGQSARIRSGAYPDHTFTGTVQFIGREIEADSRTLPIWIEVSNSLELLRPNMLTEVNLLVGISAESIAVPVTALLGLPGARYVFVEEGENYRKMPVVLGKMDDRFAEVLDGLFPGDRVVVKGQASLNYATNSPAAPTDDSKDTP